MPKKQSPHLKVTLDKKNTKETRRRAAGDNTTPPRYVNRVLLNHFAALSPNEG